jgi:hypothetical protein
MLGVLIAILNLDHIAHRSRFVGKRYVSFIAPLRVSSRRPGLLGAAKSSWLGGVSCSVHVLICNSVCLKWTTDAPGDDFVRGNSGFLMLPSSRVCTCTAHTYSAAFALSRELDHNYDFG